jgi:alpha-D-ribose 1-methylphosphonate 5-triphosphate diphosphatase
MPQLLPPLRLTGATLLRDGVLQPRSLGIAAGRIVRGPLPEVDLSGHLLLPGIVDLAGRAAGDAPQDPEARVRAQDQAAAAAGVTTAILIQGWGCGDPPEAALQLLQARAAQRLSLRVDLRVGLAANLRLTGRAADLIEAVRRHRVPLVGFADPEGAGSDHWAAADRAVPGHLCTLAEAFDDLGTLYGSFHDPDGETRERFSMIGARIALFPADRRAAAAAHAMMCPVVLSARELAAGGVADDLLAQGLCDALASDGAPALLAEAALRLVRTGRLGLRQAWALVSQRPADLARLPDRGRLNPGQRADIAILEARSLTLAGTIARGRLVHATPELARRFDGLTGAAAALAAE